MIEKHLNVLQNICITSKPSEIQRILTSDNLGLANMRPEISLFSIHLHWFIFRARLIRLFRHKWNQWDAFQNEKMGGGIAYLLDNHNTHTGTIQNQKEYPSSKNHQQEPNEHVLFNVCSFTTFAIVSSNLQKREQNMQTAVNCVLEFDTHAPDHRTLFSCFSSRSAHNSFGH